MRWKIWVAGLIGTCVCVPFILFFLADRHDYSHITRGAPSSVMRGLDNVPKDSLLDSNCIREKLELGVPFDIGACASSVGRSHGPPPKNAENAQAPLQPDCPPQQTRPKDQQANASFFSGSPCNVTLYDKFDFAWVNPNPVVFYAYTGEYLSFVDGSWLECDCTGDCSQSSGFEQVGRDDVYIYGHDRARGMGLRIPWKEPGYCSWTLRNPVEMLYNMSFLHGSKEWNTLYWVTEGERAIRRERAMSGDPRNPFKRQSYRIIYSAVKTPSFEWQSRYSRYTFLKTKVEDTPRIKASYTRLLSADSGDEFMDSIPTFVTPTYPHSYSPFNKPNAILKWLQETDWRNTKRPENKVYENEILILLDTDCLFLRDLGNIARLVKENQPWAQKAYMNFFFEDETYPTTTLGRRYCRNCTFYDPIAVPTAIHRKDMERIAPLWMKKIHEILDDRDNWLPEWTANEVAITWCAEMYGYIFASAELGIRHSIVKDFQARTMNDFVLRNQGVIHYDMIRTKTINWNKKSHSAVTDLPFPIPLKESNPVIARFAAEMHEAGLALGLTKHT